MSLKEDLSNPGNIKHKNFIYYDLYLVIYSSLLIGCTLMGFKYTYIHLPLVNFNFEIGSAVYMFPSVFIIDDIVTEVYGYAAARRMMWMGVLSFTIISILLMLAMFYPDNNKKIINVYYVGVFKHLPQIFLGLIVGIFLGSITNDYVLSKLKIKWEGKLFPVRAILSSAVGELVLQIAATTIAFWGRLHFVKGIIPIIVFCYFYKLLFDGVSCIISYPLQKITKKAEGIDVYDKGTNFNPFRF